MVSTIMHFWISKIFSFFEQELDSQLNFFTLGDHIDNSIVGFNCHFFQFFISSVLDGMRHPVNSRVEAQCLCLNCCSILKFCCHQKDSRDNLQENFLSKKLPMDKLLHQRLMKHIVLVLGGMISDLIIDDLENLEHCVLILLWLL